MLKKYIIYIKIFIYNFFIVYICLVESIVNYGLSTYRVTSNNYIDRLSSAPAKDNRYKLIKPLRYSSEDCYRELEVLPVRSLFTFTKFLKTNLGWTTFTLKRPKNLMLL